MLLRLESQDRNLTMTKMRCPDALALVAVGTGICDFYFLLSFIPSTSLVQLVFSCTKEENMSN